MNAYRLTRHAARGMHACARLTTLHATLLYMQPRTRGFSLGLGGGNEPPPRVTYSFLSFLGTVSYRIRILMLSLIHI